MEVSLDVLAQYIRPEYGILIVFLYAIGALLKKCKRFSAEWMIPMMLTCISIIVTTLYTVYRLHSGWGGETIIMGVIEGTLLAGAPVLINQIYKQVTVGRLEDNAKAAAESGESNG